MHTTTRRSLLASTAPVAVASIAGVPVAAQAAVGEDAELVRLWQNYLDAKDRWLATDSDSPEDEAAWGVSKDIERQIWTIPANGLVGFAIKQRLIVWYALASGGTVYDPYMLETLKAMERAAGLPHDWNIYGALMLDSELRPPELRRPRDATS